MTWPIPNVSTDLSGNVALVTGASSGLGRRFAQVIARCGARVVITARRVDRLQELAEEIRAAGGEALPKPGGSRSARPAPRVAWAVSHSRGRSGSTGFLLGFHRVPLGFHRFHRVPPGVPPGPGARARERFPGPC
jgi:hypothetical protein